MKDAEKKITLGQRLWGHFILTRPQQLVWLDMFASMGFYVPRWFFVAKPKHKLVLTSLKILPYII